MGAGAHLEAVLFKKARGKMIVAIFVTIFVTVIVAWFVALTGAGGDRRSGQDSGQHALHDLTHDKTPYSGNKRGLVSAPDHDRGLLLQLSGAVPIFCWLKCARNID